MRTRVPIGGYCPSQELRFAIVSRDGQYIITNEVPFQRDANIERAFLWRGRREAENIFRQYPAAFRRCCVVQVREEA